MHSLALAVDTVLEMELALAVGTVLEARLVPAVGTGFQIVEPLIDMVLAEQLVAVNQLVALCCHMTAAVP